jgi:hypothetical protein
MVALKSGEIAIYDDFAVVKTNSFRNQDMATGFLPSPCCVPGMGDSLVVKVHYRLGSRNY